MGLGGVEATLSLQHLGSSTECREAKANGLAIPYVGYLELDVQLCDKVLAKQGVLVVRDPQKILLQSVVY